MNINLAENNIREEATMRDTYTSLLVELAKTDKRVVILDADLMHSIRTFPFMDAYPERTFNCGIQEANMVGVAAGLSATGKIPYAHSFGIFATRRCYDQIFISAAYAKLNVRIIGSDPGISAAYNGGTHMPFEDMGIMRNIPEATLIEPTDLVMLEDILRKTNKMYGVFYIRLFRLNPVKVFDEDCSFEIGRAVQLKDGKDLTLICSGILVAEALKAAVKLEKEGIFARVVNMFTWKPVDRDMIKKSAEETGAIVTIENHNIINGLGSAVAEVLAEESPVPMERIGSKDLFGEVGPEDYLMKRYEMTADDIVAKAKKVLKRKP